MRHRRISPPYVALHHSATIKCGRGAVYPSYIHAKYLHGTNSSSSATCSTSLDSIHFYRQSRTQQPCGLTGYFRFPSRAHISLHVVCMTCIWHVYDLHVAFIYDLHVACRDVMLYC